MTNETLGEQLLGVSNLIEAQNKSIELQFKGINERLDKINGRVGKNEDKVNDIILSNAVNIGIYKENEIKHVINCPRIPEIKALNDKFEAAESKLADVHFFIRHPKLLIVLLSILVVVSIGTFLGSNTMRYLRSLPGQPTDQQYIPTKPNNNQSNLTYYVNDKNFD